MKIDPFVAPQYVATHLNIFGLYQYVIFHLHLHRPGPLDNNVPDLPSGS